MSPSCIPWFWTDSKGEEEGSTLIKSPHACLSQLVNFQTTNSKNNNKSLELHQKRESQVLQYHISYFRYSFIPTCNSHVPRPLCPMCSNGMRGIIYALFFNPSFIIFVMFICHTLKIGSVKILSRSMVAKYC